MPHPTAHLVTDGLAIFPTSGTEVGACGAIIISGRKSRELKPFH